MNIQDVFGSNGADDTELPEPNAELRYGGGDSEWSEAAVRGIICNPIYAGIGPYPALIEDKAWVRAASSAIDEDGKEQFLVNVLHLLRQSFANAAIDFS